MEAQEILAVLFDGEIFLAVTHEDICGHIQGDCLHHPVGQQFGTGPLADEHIEVTAVVNKRLGVESQVIVHPFLQGNRRSDQPVVITKVIGEDSDSLIKDFDSVGCPEVVYDGKSFELIRGIEIVGIWCAENEYFCRGAFPLSGGVPCPDGIDVLDAGSNLDIEFHGRTGSHSVSDGPVQRSVLVDFHLCQTGHIGAVDSLFRHFEADFGVIASHGTVCHTDIGRHIGKRSVHLDYIKAFQAQGV